MSEQFDISRVNDRVQFSGGPNEDPGIRLSRGYLPGRVFAGRLAYVHVAELTESDGVVPSSVDAIDPETGKIRHPGEIVLVDVTTTPPSIVRKVGTVAVPKGLTNSNGLFFRPEGL